MLHLSGPADGKADMSPAVDGRSPAHAKQYSNKERKHSVIDIEKTMERLQSHLRILTVGIGERSVARPENLRKAEVYIRSFHEEIGLPVSLEPYRFRDIESANVIAAADSIIDPVSSPAGGPATVVPAAAPGSAPSTGPRKRYLLGAHYDSVRGTVGADDNASAVAVQLETARYISELRDQGKLGVSIKFVSFTLEEPPAFLTACRGSRVHARAARRAGEKIDGMLCLEMVGYTCPSQNYPFPVKYLGYPGEGNFIGIVGNTRSAGLTRSIHKAFAENRELPAAMLTVPLNGWMLPSVRRSDHASFWDQGYQAVMITDTAFFRNPHYHKASDTMDKLDYRFMAQLVESLLLFFQS